MTIKSDFAILDVKAGRKKLFERLKLMSVPVTITGNLTCAWGADDGESQEFELEVTNVELSHQVEHLANALSIIAECMTEFHTFEFKLSNDQYNKIKAWNDKWTPRILESRRKLKS